MLSQEMMAHFPDHAQFPNIALMEELYRKFQENPETVDSSWRRFFEGIDFASVLYRGEAKTPSGPDAIRIFELIQAYRRFGHLAARFNPLETEKKDPPELLLENLGFSESEKETLFPTLGFCGKKEAKLSEIIAALESIYCNRIGFQYMDLDNVELEKWLQSRIEPDCLMQMAVEEKQRIVENLNKAEVFETFLHTKYQGQTRFSLEGAETLIPILAELISFGAGRGVSMFLLGMAHRGRLNVLANILQKPYSILFKEFEDTIPFTFDEMSDVKYHKGYASDLKISDKTVQLILSANSSCLESTDPIVLGQTRSEQVLQNDREMKSVGAILIHGDAAVAGQGVVYETLQMMRVPGFATGGTLHIVINNQIGYTTLPKEGRSTRYCTEIAKTFGAPVFHVNAEDPESCIFAAKLSLEIRLKFQCDVFLDLYGYRKYGHNEGDEPSYTQPLQYQEIRAKKSIRALYSEKLASEGLVEKKMSEVFEADFKAKLSKAFDQGKVEEKVAPEERFGKMAFTQPPSAMLLEPFETKVPLQLLQEVANAYAKIPAGFTLHPKLDKWVKERPLMLQGEVDWSMAEYLAFGTLACQKVAVRLAGQDSIRGTFSQRHAGFFDQKTGEFYSPFNSIQKDQARIDVYNTILSEYAALGFEFGYSWAQPNALTLWEAQYGDFIIGAEIIIDHYLVSAEQKWSKVSPLVLLLPHGYEGAGPEHSSGRLERFLQLSAAFNIQVVYPTTPAQYFHVLRRQALRPIKKPLILFTPKSLLRAPVCRSAIAAFTEGAFSEILDDEKAPANVKRLIFCTGKIYFDLLEKRAEFPDSALIRLEQLYPLHEKKLGEILAKYKGIAKCTWVQEEPENMGAFQYIVPLLQKILGKIPLNAVARPKSGSTATGSKKKHKDEFVEILNQLKTL